MSGFRVVVCGGGVAAIEGMLRLRSLAGDLVEVTLVAPNDEFVYRPLAVREAVALGSTWRYRLRDIARDAGAEWIKDTLGSVDPVGLRARTGQGAELGYDALLVAVGGRQVAPLDHALTFSDAEAGQVYERVVEDVEDEHARSVAFVVPEGPVYPLPAYELALMLAERARRAGVRGLELCVVTPEPAPLAVFGGEVGDLLFHVLCEAGVDVHLSSTAVVPRPRRLSIHPAGPELMPDRIVAMPRVAGPSIRGLDGAGADGFIPIDAHCAVPGTGGLVFAAGDATAFPVKHGGVGAQQADTAAAAIARLAGARAEPRPLRPEIRAKLLTGRQPLYLSARLQDGQGFDTKVSETPLWPLDDKIVAAELGPYLAELDRR
jgi:sulfide:quinone oxidoreductase